MQLRNKTFHVITLGCRVNLFESEWITSKLILEGAINVNKLSDAQICIINTCSVTNKADVKTKNFLNRILNAPKKELSIVMGCFSQINENFFDHHQFDIVLGNKDKNKVIELIKNFSKPLISVSNLELEEKFDIFSFQKSTKKTRAFIKIQDGCNFKCSYCIIPKARGKQRSLDKKSVLELIEKNVKSNTKEIILTGVNTAGYGERTDYNFESLLGDIDKLQGEFRVRISSLEPFQITNKMIEIVTSNPKRWCQHFHICLQSADDKILHDMNRKYSIQKFINLIDRIKKINSLISITTDYIVGFPTESNDSWKTSMENLEKIKFSNIHIFPYSDRTGTRSSLLKKVVSSFEKKNRIVELTKTNEINQTKYLTKFIGKTVNVLFEKSKTQEIQHGHSEYFFEVFVSTNENFENQIIPVKIIGIENNKVFGIL